MVVYICSFTERGALCEERLFRCFPEITWVSKRYGVATDGCPPLKNQIPPPINDFLAEAFRKRLPVVFIGSTGIAVRLSADYVKDKFFDSPVIVMDTKQQFVIPLLSGHIGGANELACMFAERLNAIPVITTASDVEKKFAVDLFAKRNGFSILNRDAVKYVTAKILCDQTVRIWIHPEISFPADGIPSDVVVVSGETPPDDTDIVVFKDDEVCGEYDNLHTVVLFPKLYCIGIGCKRGKTFDELQSFLSKSLPESIIENMYAIVSIDIKKSEIGLMELAQYHHIPFLTYTADDLAAIPGNFSESQFVLEKTGVSNVCERSAVKCAFENQAETFMEEARTDIDGVLVYRKIAGDGMTVAVAKRKLKKLIW